MDPKMWVYILLGLYIIYCFWWGLRGFFTEKKASGYAIAGRSIPFIAFLMAATAASFSGWTFIGHPGLIWKESSPATENRLTTWTNGCARSCISRPKSIG